MFLIVVCFCISLFFLLKKQIAGEPTEQVKQTVDAVIKILNNKELSKPEKHAERRFEDPGDGGKEFRLRGNGKTLPRPSLEKQNTSGTEGICSSLL